MTFGQLWTVMGVGLALLVVPRLLPGTTGPAEDLADRFAAAAIAGLALGWLVLVGAQRQLGASAPAGAASDVAFWSGVILTASLYVGRGRQRAFVSPTARLGDLAPWLLGTYGTYVSLCWLRSACLAFGSGATRWGPEAAVGVALAVGAVALHRWWPAGDGQRVSIALLALASTRLALASTHLPARPASAALAVAVAAGALTATTYRAHQARRFPSGTGRSPKPSTPHEQMGG